VNTVARFGGAASCGRRAGPAGEYRFTGKAYLGQLLIGAAIMRGGSPLERYNGTVALNRQPAEGEDFPESVKLQAKRLAAFKCCLCHNRAGDEVHHITPKADGGKNDLDNAVLLCAQCHTDNGSRPDRRKFIRQARDFWYENVKRLYRAEGIMQLVQLDKLATKDDLDGMQAAVQTLMLDLFRSIRSGSTSTGEAVNVASTMISSISAQKSSFVNYGGTASTCSRCGAAMGLTALGHKCAFCDS